MDWLSQEQLRRNLAADDTWTLYAPHRERVTRWLQRSHRSADDRLCLLGAGNLNDVDLRRLLPEFREIVLVDLDESALERGLERQGVVGDPRIQRIAPADVTGAVAEFAKLKLGTAADDEITHCQSLLARTPRLSHLGQFEVVASVGLLTQLIETVVLSIGNAHPQFWPTVSAMRAQHLRVMLGLTAPGGSTVLVTEVLSSDTCPELLSVNVSDLGALLQREIAARNFFTGTNPAALRHFVLNDPVLGSEVSDVRVSEPWLWPFLVRTYAVYGATIEKRG
jgi:hypothetical protein